MCFGVEKYINRVGSAATIATVITLGFGRGYFFAFFQLFLPYFCQMNEEGGVPMDEDEDIFEMFQELMDQLDPDDPDGRMRLISKNPRYAADDPAVPKPKYIER